MTSFKKGILFTLFIAFSQILFAQGPSITSFTPSEGSVGTLVTITGANLSTPTSLNIGGVNAITISNTGTSLVAMVMPGAATGNIGITTANGSSTSSSSFTVTANASLSALLGNKQVGTGIIGTAFYGSALSISADGNTAIVGGPTDNSLQGAAWIFIRNGGVWSQQGNKLVGTGNSGAALQGNSVSISADGNTAIVGGPRDNNRVGAVWIFTRNGGVWSQQGNKLVGTGNIGASQQGSVVSLSADGNTAIVTGIEDNSYQGAAWIFTRNGSTWSQQGSKLLGTGIVGTANRGVSACISADGNTAIVGGDQDNSDQGAAWIFTRSGGTWSQQGNKLVGTGNAGAARQGTSVSLSADGNTAMVGGVYDSSLTGAVWIYTRSGSTWSQQGNKVKCTGNIGGAQLGVSVSLSADGNNALVGGRNDNNNQGATWIFTRSGATWSQQGNKRVGTGNIGAAQQGQMVALSADGSSVIIGGFSDNGGQGAVWFSPSKNANLSTISLSSGILSPTFASETMTYTAASVSNAISSVTVTPTREESNATIQVRVNGGAFSSVISGTASSALSLNTGNNTIDVRVTAQDGSTIKTYTITITRNALTLDNIGLSASNPSQAAFGLRKLSALYLGNAIQVRRSSDNTTSDIGFTANGDLDTAALKTFVGANNGFISIWYDQSGYSRNAVQSTNGSQPQIINAGVIYRRNGKPTVYFNNTSLATASYTGYSNAISLSIVAGVQTNVSFSTFGSKATGAFAGPWEHSNSSFAYGNNSTQTIMNLNTGTVASSGFSQWSFLANASSAVAFRNGNANGTGGSATFADGGGSLYLGTRGNGGSGLIGWISEYLSFGSVLDTINRQTVENNQLNYYQNTNANLVSITPSVSILSPAFSTNTTSYTFSIDNRNSIAFTPNLEITDATIQIRINNGSYTSLSNGATSAALALNVGANTIDIKVTNTSAEKVYSIVVTRTLNTLNTLGLTNANPSPASFSLRKLSTQYTGNAIQVRRSSDNTTSDIGFTANGDLDTAALKTFVGANNGFISIWYDQSGYIRNAVQATNGSQPQIINGGVIYRRNGKPTVYFNNTSLATSSYSGYSSAFSLSIVAGVQTNGSFSTFGAKATGAFAGPWEHSNSSFAYGNNSSQTTMNLNAGTVAASGFSQWSFSANASAANAYRNGNANGSGGSATFADGGGSLYLGTRSDGTTSLIGWISEYITLGSVLDGTDRQTVENNQLNYYQNTNANLVSITPSVGTLSPAFNTNTTTYTLSIDNRNSISFTPNLEILDATIQIRINNGAYTSLSNGAASAALALNVGANTIDIKVTNTSVEKVYSIVVTRTLNTLNTLGLTNANPSPASFSLRKLSTQYTGNAIQVRRSSDNTTSDIGFTANGDLDTAALKTFVGANNGFISIWYDQSGYIRNAVQATNGSQPQIINAGVVYRRNRVPAIYFSNQKLATEGFVGYPSAFSLAIVGGVSADVGFQTFGGKTSGSIAQPWDIFNNNFYVGDGGAGSGAALALTKGLTLSTGFSQWVFTSNTSTRFGYLNGASNGNGGVNYLGDAGLPLIIGNKADGSTQLNGYISEYLTFDSVLNTNDRQTIESSQFAHYNFNIANLISLGISNGILSPSFTTNDTIYTAIVTNDISSITATPTSEIPEANIQVRVNGGSYTSVLSGGISSALSLNVGSNTINVRVTSQDGSKIKTYTINITRGASLDNVGLNSSNSSPAAFSLRKLSTQYTGNAIRVRRSNDNSTQDIGFTVNGDLDTASLKTFVGANNGFVSIWYDQSGYSRNAVQATNGSQPQIVNSGTIFRRNGKPTVYFNNTSLATASYTGYPSAFTLEIVAGIQNNTSYSTFGAKTTTGIAGPWEHWHQYFAYGNNVTQASMLLTNPVTSSSGFSQWSFAANASGATAFRNGVANATGGTTTYADGGGALYLGTRGGDGATSLNGWISEYVTFSSVLNTSDRQTIENNQLNYFQNSNANLVSLTPSIGALSPTFSTNTTTYTLSTNSSNITITPNLEIADASIQIRINNGVYTSLLNGSASAVLSLNVGVNTIDIKVTNTSAEKVYSIVVTRTLNTLTTLGLTNATLSPAAFSLRKLSSEYSGSAIRVRRSNDNITQDIGFTANGDLDTSALKAFVGANNGFVSIWYDQSGNIRNAVQATNASQPQIVNAGNVNRRNGKPIVYFNNSSIATANYTGYPNAFSLSIVAGIQTNVSFSTFGAKATGSYAGPWDQWHQYLFYGDNISHSTMNLSVSTDAIAGFSQWSFASNASAGTAFRNGISIGTGGSTTYADGGGSLYLGTRGDGTTGLIGWIGEYLTFGSVLSSTDRQTVENNQLSYFQNTNANLSSLTPSSGTLSPSFNSNTTAYTLSTNNSSITFMPNLEIADASIQIRINNGAYACISNGAISADFALNVGANTIDIKVTNTSAEKVYSIVITRTLNTLTILGITSANPSPAAFSLRKLSSEYSGFAIRVRRSNDNTTQDIGFTINGDLDTVALKSFVGANNGFISIWYDQSGNVRNATQSTNGSQPQIINAGAIFRRNGIPSIYFNSTSLATASYTGYSNAFTLSIVAGVQNNTSYSTFGAKATGGIAGPWEHWHQYFAYGNNSSQATMIITNPVTSASGFSQWSFSASANGATAFRNGLANGTSGATTYADGGGALFLGTRGDGATSLNGYIAEYVTFGSVLDSNNRKTVEASQYNYHFFNALNNLDLTSTNPSPAAFSLRKLSSFYTGSAIQVRRSSDNTTLNIGFTNNGDLDTVALKTFVGASNGFVSIWYDQSGNGRNAIQTTNGSQPQIVNSGVIYNKHGRPAIYFNSTNLATVSFIGYSSAYTHSLIAGVQTNTTYSTFGSKTISNIPGPWDLYNSSFLSGNGLTDQQVSIYSLTNGINASSGFSQWTFTGLLGTSNAYRNGSSNGSGTATFYSDYSCPIYLGTRADRVTSLNGWISEYVTFGSVLNLTDRQAVENNQLAYYNFTNSNLSALAISSGTLSPSFAIGTTSYTANVVNAMSSITVTPISEVQGVTIQVRVNGGSYSSVTSGSTSGSLSLNVGSNSVDVRLTALNGTTIKTYTITVTRESLLTWTGATNNVWNLASNWSPAEIPTPNTNVIIGNSNNDPVLNANTVVKDLTLNDTLIIGNHTLTINGAVSGSGVLRGGPNSNLTVGGELGTVRFDQSVLGTSNSIRILTMGTGATASIVLGNVLNIDGNGIVNFDASGTKTLNSSGNLVLKSTVSATASIGNVNGANIIGNVTVERFIPRRRAFRFLSSPVNTSNFISNNWQQATHITGSLTGQNGFDQSNSGTASLFTYNSGTEAWTAIPNTNATNLNIGTGYRMLIRGDRNINLNSTSPQDSAMLVLSATGSIVTGNVVFGAGSVSSSPAGIPALNAAIGSGANNSTVGWSLIGNPYASAVNWSEVTKSNVSNTFAAWNVNNAGRGSYVYHNGSSGTGNGASNIINSGQSVFVQTIGANPSLTFTEASKVSSAPPSHFKKSISDVLNIDIFIGDRAYDGLAVMFDENSNNQYDVQDFIKLVNPEINFYSYLADGTKLAMNNMKEIGTETIVPLGLNGVFNGGSYEMKFSNQNTFANSDVKLKDKFINKMYDLKSINNLTFTVTADSNSFGENRFELIFSKSATGLNTELSSSNNNFIVFPNPANNVLNLSLTTTKEDNYSYTIFNQLGAEVSNGQLDFNGKRTHALNIEDLSAGVYFIQVKNGKTAQTIKFIK